jgi:hypothetical protein
MRACGEGGRSDSKATIQHDFDLEGDIRRDENCRMASRND